MERVSLLLAVLGGHCVLVSNRCPSLHQGRLCVAGTELRSTWRWPFFSSGRNSRSGMGGDGIKFVWPEGWQVDREHRGRGDLGSGHTTGCSRGNGLGTPG